MLHREHFYLGRVACIWTGHLPKRFLVELIDFWYVYYRHAPPPQPLGTIYHNIASNINNIVAQGTLYIIGAKRAGLYTLSTLYRALQVCKTSRVPALLCYKTIATCLFSIAPPCLLVNYTPLMCLCLCIHREHLYLGRAGYILIFYGNNYKIPQDINAPII